MCVEGLQTKLREETTATNAAAGAMVKAAAAVKTEAATIRSRLIMIDQPSLSAVCHAWPLARPVAAAAREQPQGSVGSTATGRLQHLVARSVRNFMHP